MFDVLMHECAKHASEYRQEQQAGTTWGQRQEKSSQMLLLDRGNLDASGNISSREEYDYLPNSASRTSSPNLHAHSSRPALSIAYVIRY